MKVHVTQAYDDGVNIWNETGVGNCWDYYQGTDANGDGIGDTPHQIPQNTEDIAPLVSPAKIVSPDVPALVPLVYDLVFTPDTVIDNDVVWEDQSIDLTNRIVINNGGRLTLDGTTLNIKGRNDFTFIVVNEGGTLKILDSNLNSQGACIWAQKGSSLHIENSLLNKLGVWGGDGAVQVACDYPGSGNIIINNTFENCPPYVDRQIQTDDINGSGGGYGSGCFSTTIKP